MIDWHELLLEVFNIYLTKMNILPTWLRIQKLSETFHYHDVRQV